MRISDLEDDFGRYLRRRGHRLSDLDPRSAVEVMTEFYVSERLEGVDIDNDGDMLLFQWGRSSDGRQDPSFIYDITRQAIGDEDGDIWQLSLALHFPMTQELAQLSHGNRWCGTPARVDELRSFIAGQPASDFVADRRPMRVDLTFDHAE